MLSKLKKLRGRSFDELKVRSQQSLSAFNERHGWSSQAKLPSDSAFVNLLTPSVNNASLIREHFRTRSLELFFAGFSDRSTTVEVLKTRWPESSAAIIEQAEEIVAGKFDLLGFEKLSFGDPIDWHREPVSNKRAPLVHWSRIDELDAGSFGDQKVVRELSRHQYFATLGQAYWLTGDERYAQTFVSHISSWMDQNPPKLGTHWTSSLEIALRSISWLWSFHFFIDSPALLLGVFNRALKFLYLNGCHLESYLSTYFSPNTHLTGEALGLFYLGTLLPQFKNADRWKKKGIEILTAQLQHHVRPDGVYFEQSTYYHRYTIDFYLHFSILLERSGERVPDDVRERLVLLLDHFMYLTRPDGKTPLIGDDDGGCLLSLHPAPPNDFRSSLSVGAALFDRSDYKFVAGGSYEDVLWLGGPEMLGRLDRLEMAPPAKTSVAFEHGGYYVMRDGWSGDSNYLLFDCGPHGTGNCGHAHADALSFELCANGRLALVDPGTFTYTGDAESRQWFRSSFAHNTVSIDGQSSSQPGDPFSWRTIAHCTPSRWLTTNRFDYIDGTHNGYQRLQDPVTHRRSVLFIKNDYWVVRDQVISEMPHVADVRFHFAPDLVPHFNDSTDEAGVMTEALRIRAFGNGHWKQENAWFSDCYGRKQQSVACVFSATIGGGEEVISFILPRNAEIDCAIEEIEASGGRVFRIIRKNQIDILMVSGDGQVKGERLISDFRLTWVRCVESDFNRPLEIIGIDGKSIESDGNVIASFEFPVTFMTARRNHDNWQIETDKSKKTET